MSVLKLRTLIQRLFKVDSSDFKLSYTSQKMQGPKIEVDNEQRQLSFFSIESGDIVNVEW